MSAVLLFKINLVSYFNDDDDICDFYTVPISLEILPSAFFSMRETYEREMPSFFATSI